MYNKKQGGVNMAYKALYRSYRPQNFEELAGQQHIVRTLKNAISQNRIAHAYLFCGPRGTGKTTVAKLLAKAVNCTCEDKDRIPCDQCNNCLSIMKGTHPDIVEIDAASNNGVDEVRDLIEKVKYAPIDGKYKVYIIDEVHMMSPGAFNALLKTLEEPPAHVIFILATTEPHKILPTIISRCQRFDFNKIVNVDIVDRLKKVLDSENVECEDDALELIASLADGGMRDALSIMEQCLAYSSSLTVKHINEIYGIVSITQKIDFLRLLLNKNIPELLKQTEEMFQSGIDVKRLTTDLIDILKDIVIYKNTNDITCLFILNKNQIGRIIPYITTEDAFKYIDLLIEADQQYKFASNAKLYFELAILKIANQSKIEQVEVMPIEETSIKDNLKQKEEIKYEKIIEPLKEESSSIDQTPLQTNIAPIKKEETKFEKIESIDEPVIEDIPIQANEEHEAISQESVIELVIEDNSSLSQIVEVSFDDILNILVQANRKVLLDIQEKWSVIKRYQYNLNTAKLASMLCDGKVVAASSKGLIIGFEFQPLVNQINSGQYYVELKQFLNEILGFEVDFVAVLNSEWPGMRNKFIELKQSNQLPQARPIHLQHIKIVEKKVQERELTEAQSFGVELFGELVEIEGEE